MNNPIGIFDSGIGGVTVLKQILKLLPHENYLYYSDSLHNPYGEKTKEEIFSYVDEMIQFFLEKNCKAIVFACNTATALTISDFRKKYPNLPIIGIEPAYKMAHDFSFLKKTLVMATPATIQSEKFLALFHQYDNQNTILLPCPNLAKWIEKGDTFSISQFLEKNLPKEEKIEVVVLGCTHYPLIQNEIRKVLGNVVFYDGGNGVSRRLKSILEEKKLLSQQSQGMVTFYDSSASLQKEKRFYEFLRKEL